MSNEIVVISQGTKKFSATPNFFESLKKSKEYGLVEKGDTFILMTKKEIELEEKEFQNELISMIVSKYNKLEENVNELSNLDNFKYNVDYKVAVNLLEEYKNTFSEVLNINKRRELEKIKLSRALTDTEAKEYKSVKNAGIVFNVVGVPSEGFIDMELNKSAYDAFIKKEQDKQALVKQAEISIQAEKELELKIEEELKKQAEESLKKQILEEELNNIEKRSEEIKEELKMSNIKNRKILVPSKVVDKLKSYSSSKKETFMEKLNNIKNVAIAKFSRDVKDKNEGQAIEATEIKEETKMSEESTVEEAKLPEESTVEETEEELEETKSSVDQVKDFSAFSAIADMDAYAKYDQASKSNDPFVFIGEKKFEVEKETESPVRFEASLSEEQNKVEEEKLLKESKKKRKTSKKNNVKEDEMQELEEKIEILTDKVSELTKVVEELTKLVSAMAQIQIQTQPKYYGDIEFDENKISQR